MIKNKRNMVCKEKRAGKRGEGGDREIGNERRQRRVWKGGSGKMVQ